MRLLTSSSVYECQMHRLVQAGGHVSARASDAETSSELSSVGTRGAAGGPAARHAGALSSPSSSSELGSPSLRFNMMPWSSAAGTVVYSLEAPFHTVTEEGGGSGVGSWDCDVVVGGAVVVGEADSDVVGGAMGGSDAETSSEPRGEVARDGRSSLRPDRLASDADTSPDWPELRAGWLGTTAVAESAVWGAGDLVRHHRIANTLHGSRAPEPTLHGSRAPEP